MTEPDYPHQCADIIKKKIGNMSPKIALILGSGLSDVIVDNIENSIAILYQELPQFPEPSIAGHPGKMLIGNLNKVPIVCLQGRGHLYEGVAIENIKTQIRTLKLLGIQILVVTNAAGTLRPTTHIGSLMLISDHINFQGINPLMGQNDSDYGPRFIAMDNAYDLTLRKILLKTAEKIDVSLTEGVYMGVLGPSFETPAEIKAFQLLGADMIGMSTISEVILARHCGLKVLAISAITNCAAGLSDEKLSHEHTLQNAKKAERNLTYLLYSAMEQLQNEP